MRKILAVLFAVTGIWSAIAEKPAPVTAPNLLQPPVLDGKLDDPCWQNLPWHDQFTMLNSPDLPSAAITRFKIAHDEKFIYIVIECAEPERKFNLAQPRFSQRDDMIYQDDCVEIDIDSNADGTEFFQFMVGPWGALFDAERRQGGNVGTIEWDSAGFTARTAVHENGYTVETAIPIIDLACDAGTLEKGMTFNIARTRYPQGEAGRPSYSTFAPIHAGGFMQPGAFVPLKLTEIDLARYCWGFKPPYATAVSKKTDKLEFTGTLHLVNQSPQLCFAKLRVYFADEPDKIGEYPAAVAAGAGREVIFALPAAKVGTRQLVAELVDRRSNILLARRQYPVRLDYTSIAVRFIAPAWRDNFYAGEVAGELKFDLKFQLDPAELAKAVVDWRLADNADRTITEGQLAQPEVLQTISAPLPELKPGEYTFTVTVKNADSRIIGELKRVIRKLSPVPSELRLDADKVPLWQNQPILLYGWWNMDKGLDPMEKRPTDTSEYNFNMFYPIPVHFKNSGEAPIRKFLDGIHARDEKVFIYPYPDPAMSGRSQAMLPLTQPEATAIADFVTRFKDHPALAAWYLADEPELVPWLPERLRAIHHIVAQADPHHPTIIVNDTIDGIVKYADCSDILMPDPYPCFLAGGYASSPIERVSQFAAVARETGQGCWITPQGFNYGDFGTLNNRMPNLVELRNMQYQAVAMGATAICFWSYSYAWKYPECAIGGPFLAREAKLLKKLILSPRKRTPLTFTGVAKDKFIAVYAENIDGADYVLAINCAPREITPKITLPAGAAKEWHVVSEQRAVQTPGNILSEPMPAYDVNIYSTRATDATALDLSAVESRVAAVK